VNRPPQPTRLSDFGLRTSDFGFRLKPVLLGLALTLALHPHSLLACAVCYGQSDSPMAKGMNWGILTLLTTVVAVLAAFVAFFVYLARKAARAAAVPAPPQPGRASVPASPDFFSFPDQLGVARTLALPNRPEPLLDSPRPVS